MSEASAVTFDFIADRPALDFVATVAERGTTHLEKLRTAPELSRWVYESGLVHNHLQLSDDDLHRATALRDTIFRVLTARIDHTALLATDRQPVNHAAARPGPTSQLSASGQLTRTGSLDAVLSLLATDCIELFRGPDGDLLSWCADSTCTRPFIDRSRGHRRRWCDMKGCGDRAKAASYRRRRAASPLPTR